MPVEVERIALHQPDLGKALPQRRNQIAILLDGNHLPCSCEQRSSEAPRSRSDLQHSVRRAGLERIGNPRQNPGIGEKMLSQTALGPGHD